MVNMAVNSEWWKGTGHASGPGGAPASAAADALSNGLDVRLPSPPSWLILVRIVDVCPLRAGDGGESQHADCGAAGVWAGLGGEGLEVQRDEVYRGVELRECGEVPQVWTVN